MGHYSGQGYYLASGKSSKTTKSKVLGYLRSNDQQLHVITSAQVFDALSFFVEPSTHINHGENGRVNLLPVWQVDKDGERYYKSSSKRYNDCVFRALKKYLEGTGQGTLTDGDKGFFEDHPRVDEDGVDKANVLCVAQGILVPWGKGITRIYVPKYSVMDGQVKEFALALGINPMAMANNETSNEEFVTAMELDNDNAENVLKTCRFEFVEELPMRPLVVMLSDWKGNKTSGGANVSGKWSSNGVGMGHADFVGPRDALYGNWQIAFEIGPLPEYNTDINKYAWPKDAFPKEELEKALAARMTFSVWNSIIDGKSATEWSAEYREATKVAEKKKEDKVPDSVYTESSIAAGKCPECGSPTSDAKNYEYCLKCNWYIDHMNDICPFCYGTMVANRCVTKDCGYNTAQWIESSAFECEKHGVRLFFRRREKDEIDKDAQAAYSYACPECLFENDYLLQQYYDNGSNLVAGFIARGESDYDSKEIILE